MPIILFMRLFNFFKGSIQFLLGGAVTLMLLAAGVSFAAPTQAPSSGTGVSLPLHVGAEAQTKAGELTVSKLNTPQVCLAGDCQSAWPSGSSIAVGSSTYSHTQPGNTNSGSYFSGFLQIFQGSAQDYSSTSQYRQNTFSISLPGTGTVLTSTNYDFRCYFISWYSAQINYNYLWNQYGQYYTIPSSVTFIPTGGSEMTMNITCDSPPGWWPYVLPVGTYSYLYQ
jgi:hypothetical protein